MSPKRLFEKISVLIGLILGLSSAISGSNNDDFQRCTKTFDSGDKKPLVRINTKTSQILGLTDHGIEQLMVVRDALRKRHQQFESQFRQLRTLHHAGLVARLNKGHMFIYGLHGSAKSAFVKWMLRGEKTPAFELQLHQMITEQHLIGGQNYDAFRQGRIETNTNGSLADFVVAVIDETQNGNPAVLSVLNSLINVDEREIRAGNTQVKAKLETLFSTSNANLPEILDMFEAAGLGSSGKPLIDRFQFKAFIDNWLPAQDQAELDRRSERRIVLEALADDYPEVLKDEVFQNETPEPIDWPLFRRLSRFIFVPGELLIVSNRELAHSWRDASNKKRRESEANRSRNPKAEPFIYVPAAQLSTRSRKQILPAILFSAMIDFLLTNLADDPELSYFHENHITLDPLSLWRAHLSLTTIGMGTAHTVIDGNSKSSSFEVNFDWSISPEDMSDEREEWMVKNTLGEQKRFGEHLKKIFEKLQKNIELNARFNLAGTTDDIPVTSFEILMLGKQKQ